MKSKLHIRFNHHHGFSLIELAMVMMIISILLGGLFVAIGDSANNVRRTNTANLLKQVEEALYGYAQLNGRLPCPVNHLGVQMTCDPGTTHHGFISNAELGLSSSSNAEGLLLDAWQNPLRYSVYSGFTVLTEIQTIFQDSLLPNDMFAICDLNEDGDIACGPNRIPAIVLSMGANWANFNQGDFSSAFEVQNAGGQQLGEHYVADPATRDFYSMTYNEASFDDQLIWLSPHILFSRMVRAGRLP